MKKLIFFNFVFLINWLCVAQAVRVTLPDELKLKEQINEVFGGGMHFTQKTSLVENLANTEKEALDIVTAVKSAVNGYTMLVPEQMKAVTPFYVMPILRSILQHNPEAIEELEEKGELGKSSESPEEEIKSGSEYDQVAKYIFDTYNKQHTR